MFGYFNSPNNLFFICWINIIYYKLIFYYIILYHTVIVSKLSNLKSVQNMLFLLNQYFNCLRCLRILFYITMNMTALKYKLYYMYSDIVIIHYIILVSVPSMWKPIFHDKINLVDINQHDNLFNYKIITKNYQLSVHHYIYFNINTINLNHFNRNQLIII